MGFFNLNEPRKFNYRPVYYDEDKEAREELISNAKRDLGIKDENEEYKPQIKGKFKQSKKQEHISLNFKRKEQKKSNSRLIILIGLLLMLVYFFFLK